MLCIWSRTEHGKYQIDYDILDLKLSPCSEYCFSSQTRPISVIHPHLPIGSGNFEPNLYLYKYPSNVVPFILLAYTTYEDITDKVFRDTGTLSSDAGESPKRKNTACSLYTFPKYPNVSTIQNYVPNMEFLISSFHLILIFWRNGSSFWSPLLPWKFWV
jgi:hypothetical protein